MGKTGPTHFGPQPEWAGPTPFPSYNVNDIRHLFVHLFTLLMVGPYLSYGTNIISKSFLKAKLDIWSNIRGICVPHPDIFLKSLNYLQLNYMKHEF